MFISVKGLPKVRIEPPLYIEKENGATVFETVTETDFIGAGNAAEGGEGGTESAVYSSLQFTATDTITALGGGLFSILRKVTSRAAKPIEVKLVFTMRPCFAETHWLIPCINYNGNEYGDGNYPKGFMRDGEPWIFSYDRTGIPSCSLSENDVSVAALFASDRDAVSLTSSVSVTKNGDGSLNHMIYYPVTEAPFSYTNTDTLTARLDTYLTFTAGETKEFETFVYLGSPMWKNYGIASLLDRVCELYDLDIAPTVSAKKLREVGIAYAKQLVKDYNGHRMFASARRADFGAEKFNPPADSFEIGWAGQGALNSRLFILEYRRTGEKNILPMHFHILMHGLKSKAKTDFSLLITSGTPRRVRTSGVLR